MGGRPGRTACLLVAAGSGTRLAAGVPKAFAGLAGRSLLEHALERVLASGCVDLVVAVVPAELQGPACALLPGDVVVVPGGGTRQASVTAGLAGLSAAEGHDGVDVVLVHDAARCLAPAALVARVEGAVRSGHPVVVPAVPVHDTVRMVGSDADGGVTGSTLVDRSRLRAVQTPQGFAREVLEQAHRAGAHLPVTDDATLAEHLGHPVHLVPGAEEAFKVTRPLDLALAQALIGRAGG